MQFRRLNSSLEAFRPSTTVLCFGSLVLTLALRRRAKRQGVIVLWFISCFIIASGFTYKPALPGRRLSFPADHYSHPDFRTEWWYYTGHLRTESGQPYGYQVTFFRFGVRDRQNKIGGEPPLFTDLYMAHFALSDLNHKKFFFRERINRGYHDRAGAATDRFLVWNEDWKLQEDGKHHVIRVQDGTKGLHLRLISLKPAVLHGQNGLSQKGEGEGRASYYYSFTRMSTEGEITIGGRTERVRGASWMDHEFGSNQLREDQVGWDWFSIQLENGTELMLYLIRRRDGSPDPYSSGTLVKPDGTTQHLALKDFRIDVLERWKSPKSGAHYPMKWNISVAAEDIQLELAPGFPDQELITNRSTRITYWEGAVRISGKVSGRPITGAGYVEMTGYAGRVTI
jgi:predicted secreted hydrolase